MSPPSRDADVLETLVPIALALSLLKQRTPRKWDLPRNFMPERKLGACTSQREVSLLGRDWLVSPPYGETMMGQWWVPHLVLDCLAMLDSGPLLDLDLMSGPCR